MSPASVLSSMLCKTSAKVFQVTGCFSLPFENLHIDLFGIILVFVSYGMDPYCIVIFQQENTKLVIVDSNLLGNIDLSHSSLKFNAFTQSWSINLLIYWTMEHVRTVKARLCMISQLIDCDTRSLFFSTCRFLHLWFNEGNTGCVTFTLIASFPGSPIALMKNSLGTRQFTHRCVIIVDLHIHVHAIHIWQNCNNVEPGMTKNLCLS